MIEIDLISDGSEYDYTQTVQLEGLSYRLRMLYNERREVWTLYLTLEDGTSLVNGQTCVVNSDLLRYCFVEGRPPGNLFVGTYGAYNETPDLTALGDGARTRMFYIPFSELSA